MGMTQVMPTETSEILQSDVKIYSLGCNTWTSQRISFNTIFDPVYSVFIRIILIWEAAEFHGPLQSYSWREFNFPQNIRIC